MRIALVLCPFMGNTIPSLGVVSIHSFLKKDFKTDFFDFNIDFYKNTSLLKYNFSKFVSSLYYINPNKRTYKLAKLNQKFINKWTEELLKINPDVICFSCYQSNFLMSLKLAENVKRWNKKITIVFGGPNCSLNYYGKDVIKKEFIDFVAVGEGELVLKELLKNLKKNKKIRGLLYKVKGKVRYNGDYLPIKNLDSLPLPDFSIFNLENYSVLPLSFSRGCPYNCAFCAEKVFWKKYRYKSIEKIIKEIIYIKKKYKIKNFGISDSLINGNIHLLEKICDELIKRRVNISWIADCRLDKHLTIPFLKKMRKAGCIWIKYGIESGSSRILKKIGKESDIKLIEKIIKNTYNAGIKVSSGWIIGFPTETSKDFLETLKFIWRNKKWIRGGILGGFPCSIIPKTELYKNYEKYGIKNPKRKFDWNTTNFSLIKRMVRYLIFFGYKTTINYFYKQHPLGMKKKIILPKKNQGGNS